MIVGGGPAACAAALGLRALGRSVVVVAAPNVNRRPTETAAPTLRSLLIEIGGLRALSACEPCFGIQSDWGGDSPAYRSGILNPGGPAWFIHRNRFDKELRDLAIGSGAGWIQAAARDVRIHDDRISIMAGQKLIEGRWLIVATGSSSGVAENLGHTSVRFDSLVAYWMDIPHSIKQRALSVETADYGWWYVCPGDGERTVACLMTDPIAARELGLPEKYHDVFAKTNLANKLGLNEPHLTMSAIRLDFGAMANTVGLRWMIVGDAAAKLDPLGSSGTITALESGRRSALAIAGALSGSSEEMHKYGRWNSALFSEFVRQRQKHYLVEAARRNTPFWSRRISN